MKKSIVKYLNRQYPFDNEFIINDEFFIDEIKDDLKSVFGENILNEFDMFDDWLFILFPDKVIKIKKPTGFWSKSTYDDNSNQLTFERSDGYWSKSTYDNKGNELTFKDSYGTWYKSTYYSNGKVLTFVDSTGYWDKRTFDSNGKQLSYENSNGYWDKRTYDDNGNLLSYEDSYDIKTNN